MKRFFIIPLVIFSFLSSKSFADNGWMWTGDKKFMRCSQLIKNLNEKGLLDHYNNELFISWIRGFVSGMNVANDKYLKTKPDMDGITLEVIKRCKEEPMNTSLDALFWIYKNKMK